MLESRINNKMCFFEFEGVICIFSQKRERERRGNEGEGVQTGNLSSYMWFQSCSEAIDVPGVRVEDGLSRHIRATIEDEELAIFRYEHTHRHRYEYENE